MFALLVLRRGRIVPVVGPRLPGLATARARS